MSESNGAWSPAGDRHPGEIHYVDHVDDRRWVREATKVPPGIAWVDVGGRWRPVVRIEIRGTPERREIIKYGEGDEFLESTFQS